MKILNESHLDHGLTAAQVEFLRTRYAGKDAAFIDTVELPPELGTVPCALAGPIMGDGAIGADAVRYLPRTGRPYPSRLTLGDPRPTRLVTVIAGPHGDEPCVLYTAFGGPLAPKEPSDPTLEGATAVAESLRFWTTHALRVPAFPGPDSETAALREKLAILERAHASCSTTSRQGGLYPATSPRGV